MESAKRKPRIHAFFLSFYQSNAELGLSEFISLIRTIGGEFDIYFIDNGNNREVSLPEFVRHVKGDNSGWEFSGWDAGIRHTGGVKDGDLYIFCNDTFCFHRKWSDFERARFVKSFWKLRNLSVPGLSGEFCSFNKVFELDGVRLHGWVSTYLFGMTGRLLNMMNAKLSLPEHLLNQLFRTIENNRIIWGKEMDTSLSAHISNWLFPKKDADGWYRADNASEDIKIGKVRAILNEKYLASCCVKHGGSIIRTNPTLLARALRKVGERIDA